MTDALESNEADDDARPGYFDRHAARIDSGARLVGVEQGWSAPVAFIDAAQGFGEAVWVPGVPQTVLSVWLAGERAFCRWGPNEGRSARHFAYTLQPRGVPNHFEAEGAVSFAQVFLPDTLIDGVADGLRPGVALSGALRDDLVFARDRELNQRLAAYLRAARAPLGPSRVEMDARATLVVERLLAGHHGLGAPASARFGGLAPWQLKRVVEALAAEGGDRLSLAELAAVARLSPFHFTRAFKASLGAPPHRHQMRMRIARAQALLVEGKLSIGEVAAAVGYDNQSYFAKLFRAEVGATPADYRRERRR